MRLNELREELDECVETEDFSRAAEVKNQLKEVEMNRSLLLDQSKPQAVQISTAKVNELLCSFSYFHVGTMTKQL